MMLAIHNLLVTKEHQGSQISPLAGDAALMVKIAGIGVFSSQFEMETVQYIPRSTIAD